MSSHNVECRKSDVVKMGYDAESSILRIEMEDKGSDGVRQW